MELVRKGNNGIDIMQCVAVLMSIKVLLSFSSIFRLPVIVDNALTFLSIQFCCMVIINKTYSYHSFILSFVFGLAAIYTCITVDSYELLITVMTILALKDYNFSKFLRTIFKTERIILIFHVFYSVMYSVFWDYSKFIIEGDRRWRFTFGFVHSNSFSTILFGVILIYIWINFDENLKNALVKSCIIECISFALSDSRTALMSYIILIILIVLQEDGRFYSIIKVATKLCVPALSLIMFFLIKGYKSGSVISVAANRLLTSRIKLGAYAIEKSGITLFGQSISYMSNSVVWDAEWQLNTFTFDNVYTYCLMSLGVIWILILTVTAIVISRKLKVKSCVFFLVWASYGLSEVTVLNGYICFPLFLIALVLYQSESNLELYEIGREE